MGRSSLVSRLTPSKIQGVNNFILMKGPQLRGEPPKAEYAAYLEGFATCGESTQTTGETPA